MTLKYRTIEPSKALQGYVRFFWVLESDEPYTHYSLADVCSELIFHYKGKFDQVLDNGQRISSFRCGISAPSNQVKTFECNNAFGIFGVYLYPHAIPALFNVPASELTNSMIDLQSLAGENGIVLEDKILTSNSDIERVAIMEKFIIDRLHHAEVQRLSMFEAFNYVLSQSISPTVRGLSIKYNLSERQLERQFLKLSGFSPKQFIRIARFHRAASLYGSEMRSLTDIALSCGYYDQSHFTNEFTKFSGFSPSAFFKGITAATAWRER